MSDKGKIYLSLIILAVAGALFLISKNPGQVTVTPTVTPTPTPTPMITASPSESGQPCIQVITKARNPQTGEIKDFSTPCDVPEGWEKI